MTDIVALTAAQAEDAVHRGDLDVLWTHTDSGNDALI